MDPTYIRSQSKGLRIRIEVKTPDFKSVIQKQRFCEWRFGKDLTFTNQLHREGSLKSQRGLRLCVRLSLGSERSVA